MAEIVQSLFGVTPEAYQQAQSQRGDAMALRYAQLDPFQQANYAIGRGAYGLAGAVGGLLGGQDPELQRITARQQIAKQINPNDPASIQQGIMALQQAGDTQGALMLQSEYQKMQESSALIGQRQAASIASLAQAGRERTQATAKEIQIASEYASTFGEKGSQEYIDAYRASLRGEEKKDKPIVVGNALVNPNTGAVIYQSPNEKLDTVVVGGNLVDKATGRVIFTAPETQVKPIVVDNKLVNPVDGTVIYESPSKKLDTAVVSGNLVDVNTGAVIFKAPDKVTPEPTTPELTNARAVALRSGPVGSPEYNAAFDAEYKRLTEEKAPREPTTAELTNARAIAAQAGPLGSPEYNAAFNTEYKRLTAEKASVLPSVGTDRTAISLELYNKPFDQLTTTERAAVNKRVEAEQGKRTPKVQVQNIMPGDKNLADIPAFRASVQRTIDPQLKTITATDQALTAINDSLATGNFAAYRAAQVQFARAISGAGDMSQKELKAAGADPSLLGGTADYLSTVFSSTPTADTQKKIRSTLQAIQTVARRQAQGEVDQQRKMALRSPGYNAEAVNEALNFPQLQVGAAPGAGGDLAAQAAAELARRKGSK
jgi:hypothetical protein